MRKLLLCAASLISFSSLFAVSKVSCRHDGRISDGNLQAATIERLSKKNQTRYQFTSLVATAGQIGWITETKQIFPSLTCASLSSRPEFMCEGHRSEIEVLRAQISDLQVIKFNVTTFPGTTSESKTTYIFKEKECQIEGDL